MRRPRTLTIAGAALAALVASGPAATAQPETDTTPPSKPDNLRVLNATDTNIQLGWGASTDNSGIVIYFLIIDNQPPNIMGSGMTTHDVEFSLGFSITAEVQAAVLAVPADAWVPAYDLDGQPRKGAWVAEITDMLNLAKWPPRSRVIVRRERPHPGAQLRFTDTDGHRFTAFITDTTGGQLADLETHHRSHARVEDRIRCGKTTGLRNLPCRGYAENKAWLELALTAADLLTWAQALCFTGDLARCEPATFRYRICAIAAKLTRTARVPTLHLDRDWPWAPQLATAFTRLRTAPWPG